MSVFRGRLSVEGSNVGIGRAPLALLFLTLLVFASAPWLAAAEPETPLRYVLSYSQEAAAELVIELTWKTPLDEDTAFVVPRSIPMGYGEQPYDGFLRRVRGVDAAGGEQSLERQQGPRWTVPAGTVAVRYAVDLETLEREVLSAADQSRQRDGYVSLLGYSVFGYLEGRRQENLELVVEAPDAWPVHATLAPAWPVASSRVEANAANFYELADSQIVMGSEMTVQRLLIEPVPLYLVSYAEGSVDLERTGRLARTAFERVSAYFGEVPFDHYTMHLELLEPISPEHEYGFSMEHLSSSTFYLDAGRGLTATSPASEDARNLYNFAHHIAHAWLPKRAYGPGYFPFSWELAPVLDTIWFSEGFGQYAAIVAVGAGEADPSAYRRGLLDRRFQASVDAAPRFLREMTLEQLSRVASTRYSQDFRTGRLVFSRGGLMAAAVDDRIRAATAGERSLSDALRHLVAWTRENPRGFRDTEELVSLITEATGVDVSEVVSRWLAPLP